MKVETEEKGVEKEETEEMKVEEDRSDVSTE